MSPNDLGEYAHCICFALVRSLHWVSLALTDPFPQGLLLKLKVFEADSIFEDFWLPYSEHAEPAAAQAYRHLYSLTSHHVHLFAVEDAITNTLADTLLDIALAHNLLDFVLWDCKSFLPPFCFRSAIASFP